MTDRTLISITEAARRGIDRVRMPVWANPLDHIKIDIVDGSVGPWLHLYAPFNKERNGRDPVDFLWIMGALKTDVEQSSYEPYTGPLPDSDEYKAAAAKFEGGLGEKVVECETCKDDPQVCASIPMRHCAIANDDPDIEYINSGERKRLPLRKRDTST